MPPSRPRASEQISEFTTARLSVYLRCLDALDEAGLVTVSSGALAERFHLNAALIRKDLAYFGEFGVRGVGYYVKDLRRNLRQILGLDRSLKVVIVGAGNLGLALADYPGFRRDGFEVVALFDVAAHKIGQRSRGGVLVRPLDDLSAVAAGSGADIAILAVPRDAAQEAVDRLGQAGIRAVLNFAPGTVRVPEGVKVKSVDFSVSLESLSFFLAQESNGEAP